MEILNKILDCLIRLGATFLAVTPIAVRLCALAYAERGYRAVGGEWILILLVALSVWWLTGFGIKALDRAIERREKREHTIHYEKCGRGNNHKAVSQRKRNSR